MKIRKNNIISLTRSRKVSTLFLAGALTLILMAPICAGAADINSLIKQANKDIRTSERQMFSGKNDEAIAGIQSVRTIIESIKQEDPNNRNIKNLENKVKKIVKSIERKTGRNLGGGSGTVQASSKQTLPDKPAVKPISRPLSANKSAVKAASSEKLSHKVRQLIKEARTNVASAEDKVKMLSQPRFAKMTLKQKTKMVDRTASRARQKLEEAKVLAAAEGVVDHPDFNDIAQRLTAIDALVSSDTAKADKQEQQKVATGAAIKGDFESLQAARENAENMLGKYSGGKAIYYNKLEEAEAMFAVIEKFENNSKQALLQQQKDFGSKHGTTAEAIDGKAKAVGYWPTYHAPSGPYLGITELVQQTDLSKVAMAEDLAKRSTQMIASTHIHDFFVRENYEDARKWLALAVRFSPDNTLVENEQKTIDSRIADGLKVFYDRIDARAWPPESAAGGSPQYQSVAKDYFVQSNAWAKREKNPYNVLDLKVSGPWSVQKKDLFGSPVMYGLPVIAAVQLEKDKKDNLARVFHMTLRTPESANPTTAPPFTSDTVGDSYFVRKTAIK